VHILIFDPAKYRLAEVIGYFKKEKKLDLDCAEMWGKTAPLRNFLATTLGAGRFRRFYGGAGTEEDDPQTTSKNQGDSAGQGSWISLQTGSSHPHKGPISVPTFLYNRLWRFNSNPPACWGLLANGTGLMNSGPN